MFHEKVRCVTLLKLSLLLGCFPGFVDCTIATKFGQKHVFVFYCYHKLLKRDKSKKHVEIDFCLNQNYENYFNLLLCNVIRWSDSPEKSCSKCCKICKVCLTILQHCEVKAWSQCAKCLEKCLHWTTSRTHSSKNFMHIKNKVFGSLSFLNINVETGF